MMCFFFFNDSATTEINTLSLHDALPIFVAAHGVDRTPVRNRHQPRPRRAPVLVEAGCLPPHLEEDVLGDVLDRKSTRLNSSHANISYAVFCLKLKNL